MLTSNEVQALTAILEEAIVKSSEEDDGDPVFHEVNTNDVNPFSNKQIQSEVHESLLKLGLIEGSISDDGSGKVFEFVCITPEGLDALKSVKGVH
jgi:hypothetical protein